MTQPYKADLEKLQKMYDDLIEKNENISETVRRKMAMRDRKITQLKLCLAKDQA